MITYIARILLLAACLCGMQVAYACSCASPSLKATFADSDEVFVARVLSVRLVKTAPTAPSEHFGPGSIGTYEVKVRIMKTFKGESVRSATLVYSSRINFSSCSKDIQVGEELLVLRKHGMEVDTRLCSGRVIANPPSDYIDLLESLVK